MDALFKAKQVDTGLWVEGFYFEYKDRSFIIKEPYIEVYHSLERIQDFTLEAWEVDPKSLCRYIGFYDKNNHKIWENDIITRTIISDYDYDKITGIVKWTDFGFTGFKLKTLDSEHPVYYPMGRGQFDDDESITCNDEIIGNLFDKPKLVNLFLEGKL